jgi:hypothetical protein
MLRYYDWECSKGHVHADLVEVPHGTDAPRFAEMHCPDCGGRPRAHRRIVSLTAKYLGEKLHSPMVYGSDLDTAGWKQPSIPMPHPPEADGPPGADGYTNIPGEALREHFETPAWKEWYGESKALDKENAFKRKRRRAIKAGKNVDVKHHRVAGDPKL